MTLNKKIMASLLALVLSGCASFAEDEFSCGDGSDKGACGSTRDIYKATHTPIPDKGKITIFENGEKSIYDVNTGRIVDDESEKKDKKKSSGNEATQLRLNTKSQVPHEITNNRNIISENKENDLVINNSPLYTYSADGIPIRTPTVVQRIWYAPWRDKDDDLHMSGLIYTDIVPRKWQITNVVENNRTTKGSGMIKPFKAPSRINSKPPVNSK